MTNNKDWVGNANSVFKVLGANNHCDHEYAEHSYYATDPNTLEMFLNKLKEDGIELHERIWECACGEGHLSKVLEQHGYSVVSSDLIDRGYGHTGVDFLKAEKTWDGDILTNPPYKYAKDFVEKGIELITTGKYMIMLLKIQFLEGKDRYELFQKLPPKYVYVNSSRQTCYINGDMSKKMSSASCYCWFVWEKGWHGEPTVRWII